MRRLSLLATFIGMSLMAAASSEALVAPYDLGLPLLLSQIAAPGTNKGETGSVATFAVSGHPQRGPYELARADTTEKERVKKEEPKERAKDTRSVPGDESDDSSFFECLGGCLGSFCAGLFEDDETEVVAQGVVVDAGPDLVAEPFSAVIEPANPYADEVTVWDNPGGREGQADIVGSVPTGAEVTVTESQYYGEVLWVRIVTPETPATVGWVPDGEIVPVEIVEPLEAVSPLEEEPFVDLTQRVWQLTFDASYPVFSEGQINDEYKDRIFRIGAGTRWSLPHALQLGLAASYIHSNGKPQYDFEVGSVTESPSNSKLQIWDLGVRFGQFYNVFGPEGFFLWEIGPSVFNVKEKADITIIENKVVIGSRTDRISEWEVGADFRIEFGLEFVQIPVSLHAMYSVLPWDSHQDKSLTLDFLEKDRIDIFSFGITFGYSFY